VLGQYTAAVKQGSLKLLLTALLLPLTGCFQAQLHGVVGGAEVELSTLQQPGQVIATMTSVDADTIINWKGRERWDQWTAVQQLAFIGVFRPGVLKQPPGQCYLLTVRGGINRDPQLSREFQPRGRPVRGPWHAILPPGYVRGMRNKVSLLTEVAYQWYRLRGSATDPEHVAGLLDDLAVRLVSDVDGDGSVDYRDVLVWDVYRDRDHYLGEMAALENFDAALTAGFPQVELERLVLQLLDEYEAPPEPGLLDYLRWRFGGDAD